MFIINNYYPQQCEEVLFYFIKLILGKIYLNFHSTMMIIAKLSLIF